MSQQHYFVSYNRNNHTFRRTIVLNVSEYLTIIEEEIAHLKKMYPLFEVRAAITMNGVSFNHNDGKICRLLADNLKLRFANLDENDEYVTISL